MRNRRRLSNVFYKFTDFDKLCVFMKAARLSLRDDNSNACLCQPNRAVWAPYTQICSDFHFIMSDRSDDLFSTFAY